MPDPLKVVRVASLKNVAEFRERTSALGLELPCEDKIATRPDSPLATPVPNLLINGKPVANRCAVHPMEGWDGTTSGGVTPEVRRRWRRFGQSGAKVIFGGEAMAVRLDGRANPRQLVIREESQEELASLREEAVSAHRELYGSGEDLIIGFQLTHSGRFCKPHSNSVFESKVAYRHPLLDRRVGVTSDAQVLSDADLDLLVEDFIQAAKVASNAGADFVDIKHCHGYLLHELLSAFTRPGKYGGAFENRTRFLRDVVSGIRASGNPIDVAVRLSAFDFAPFRPDPSLTSGGKLGPGIPEDFSNCQPYRYAFGVDQEQPLRMNLEESHRFIELCGELGVKLVNVTAGSPYYNPHIQRPAAYPPVDGYQPPEDPLAGVARQITATRLLKAKAPPSVAIIGTGYSYLQEFLPHVAQYTVRHGWTDMVGIGRMVLSYPTFFGDVLDRGALNSKLICRTFSDCTTAPRKGLISGCYPLDRFYAERPEGSQLKQLKRA